MPAGVKHLLAPVPIVHIPSARVRAAETGGRVAFGSGDPKGGALMYEFFAKVDPGMPVLIHVRMTGKGLVPDELHPGPVFSYRGEYDGFGEWGKFVDLQPQSTIDDGSFFALSWKVKNFQRLQQQDYVPFFRAGIKQVIRRPVIGTVRTNA